MCKVYLYSRVSTDQQTLAQQERTVYEWLNAHQMKVDRIVSDEGVSGGVSYADRKLGKELLPMTVEGDMIIVSEISRLGRSMFDLSKLIHTELKPRKLRLVVVSMGIDLNCAKMTAIDELILNNFSFAAQLEKQLISERTLSALAVKRKQGVKFGASSDKYIKNRKNKTKEQLVMEGRKRGNVKTSRYLESKDVQAFIKAIRKTFPDYTEGEPYEWKWKFINTKKSARTGILTTMRDFKEIDNSLFRVWDFSDIDSVKLQYKLNNYLHSLKRSVISQQMFNN
jgi:DNA invertase Pin-like site-specific DNA recombinase